ncbi:ABC transporter ATP-binding protein [Lutispora thermophila]|uniref:ABC-2 type transport system ATP-binding protein n=1 Tax=Lutispora thermophila DSM 19022 TaxID=1122184 RepID=A0A1M6D4P8_9FIRM|nr:ABC transporter ATP-binding protein [Lutispora thermophila]SHI68063.1 ABC-2 type transport system ATP-binding protein [Lutispora thermophila DSM 19022]
MISVEHLTKRYGDFTAVDDLTFEINEGHVYGFLGPNGAGKSTTMNIMTGCLSATEGHVRIDGYDIFEEPNKAKKLIGYLPEQPPLYLNETPLEYLRFVGEAKGLRGAELKKQIEQVIHQTRIEDVKNRRISSLSKGYRQRVGIAQALLGNPKVIILDEPTVGLDPIQIIEIRDLVKELGQTHTVIFSSHILSEVQAICDQVLIIAKGKLIAFDKPENLEKRLLAPNEIIITSDATAEETKEILAGIDHIIDTNMEEKDTKIIEVHIRTDHDNIYEISRAIFFAFAAKGKALLEMSLKKANLEDIFIELTEKSDDTEILENGTVMETTKSEVSDV